MTSILANRAMPNLSGWQDRHDKAVHLPKSGFEHALLTMLRGWNEYASSHREAYESPVGDDGVIGEAWQDIGKGILGLLNGQTGRLDCGTLDTFIRETLVANNASDE